MNLIRKSKSFLARTFILVVSISRYIFKYRKYKAIPFVKMGFQDHLSRIETSDARFPMIFERLIAFYHKAKTTQQNVDKPYHISQMWQQMVEDQFSDLVFSLRAFDALKLRLLLENFQREKFAFSSGGSASDYHSMQKSRLFQYEFINAWYKYFNIYEDLKGSRPELDYPLVGNPAGLYYNGHIIPTEAIRYHYYAAEITSLLCDVENPIICEIGAGLGGQAYKIIDHFERPITYILLDIPEMLVVSAYFLMAALPEKKVFLYGEDTLNQRNVDRYDIILLPHFMLSQLQDQTVDLFFNSNSFSEMYSDTVREYLAQIERVCRRYFMHINHNVKFVWHDNGEEITNMRASDIIPNPEQFKKIYQHPRVFSKIDDEIFYYRKKGRHFAFLYERMYPVLSAAKRNSNKS